MQDYPFSPIHKGSLLVATPAIHTGLFTRSVILICEHNPGGSFGLILNKALDVELPEEILDTTQVLNPNLEMRTGGPIQMTQMMLLHTQETTSAPLLPICPGLFLGGDLDFLQQAALDAEGPPVRLCFGYSGWSAGQLDKELEEELWFVHPAHPRHVFSLPSDSLWKTVLQEMGGKYAPLADLPDDLSLN